MAALCESPSTVRGWGGRPAPTGNPAPRTDVPPASPGIALRHQDTSGANCTPGSQGPEKFGPTRSPRLALHRPLSRCGLSPTHAAGAAGPHHGPRPSPALARAARGLNGRSGQPSRGPAQAGHLCYRPSFLGEGGTRLTSYKVGVLELRQQVQGAPAPALPQLATGPGQAPASTRTAGEGPEGPSLAGQGPAAGRVLRPCRPPGGRSLGARSSSPAGQSPSA